jgi:hypothetical protein
MIGRGKSASYEWAERTQAEDERIIGAVLQRTQAGQRVEDVRFH